MEATMNGIERIAAERKRQIEIEGWDQKHDAEHTGGELADAAACYADAAASQARGAGIQEIECCYVGIDASPVWPWDEKWFKLADDPVRNLEKAGALIAAEIDRILAARAIPEKLAL